MVALNYEHLVLPNDPPFVYSGMADVALETEDEREIAETLEEISSGNAFWRKNDSTDHRSIY